MTDVEHLMELIRSEFKRQDAEPLGPLLHIRGSHSDRIDGNLDVRALAAVILGNPEKAERGCYRDTLRFPGNP